MEFETEYWRRSPLILPEINLTSGRRRRRKICVAKGPYTSIGHGSTRTFSKFYVLGLDSLSHAY